MATDVVMGATAVHLELTFYLKLW